MAKKSSNKAQEVSFSKNQFVVDEKFYQTIGNIVTKVLKNNGCDWMAREDIEDLQQTTAIHVWTQSSKYDPSKGASPLTWATTIAHNYVIDRAKELWKAHCSNVSLDQLDIFGGSDADDDADFPRRKRFECGSDSTYADAEEQLSGLSSKEYAADYLFEKEAEDDVKARRFANLRSFLDTELNPAEKQMLEMLQDGLTKDEMMAKTGKSGGNIDTSKSRFRAKVDQFMKGPKYNGLE